MKLCLKDAYASSSYNKTFDYVIDGSEFLSLPATLASDAVSVTVTVSSSGGEVFCGMRIVADFVVPCSRCLKEFELHFDSDTQKPVLKDDGLYDEDAVYLDRSLCFDVIDEAFARISFEFPMAPRCSEDCKGLCPVCGCDLNVQSCTCDIRTVDPRLAVLKKLIDK